MKVKEETKRRRFLKLLKKFRELPEERFDLRSWVGSGNVENRRFPSNFLTKSDCGTTGCVAGWTVAWFPRCWAYDGGGFPSLEPLEVNQGLTVARNMAEFFGGRECDWENIIYQLQYVKEKEYCGRTGVPKHLVMERLTKLYNELYKKRYD